jgi:hypothetical protein
MKQLSLLLASLVLASCFSAPKINEEFNKSDLSANLVDSLDVYTNSLYKMPKAYTNDYIIATIRMNALNVEYAKIPVIIQLNLLAAANASEYNFDYIKERLSDREMNEFISIFPDSLIKRHSIDDEKSRHKILAEQLTCKPEIVDAHWAEYSVTGDSRIIDKMIGSIRPDVPCCITCIEWSVPSMLLIPATPKL